ncbi:gamma-glutamyltransferase, partial [Staphylococcus epidermidis]|uniref:gamma-glutamyltransferase n=1 Tax=Staphylococcus epidermidis TaxID=1282 RepID=UPI001642A7F3
LNKVNIPQNTHNPSHFHQITTDNTTTTHFLLIHNNPNLPTTTNTLSTYFPTRHYIKHPFYINNSLPHFTNHKSTPNHPQPHNPPTSFISPSLILPPNFYIPIPTPPANNIPTILNQLILHYLNSHPSLQQSINKPTFYNHAATIFY